jgi:hypothetical protein
MISKSWFAAIVVALALAGARCNREVQLGVDPRSDAADSATGDAGTDG